LITEQLCDLLVRVRHGTQFGAAASAVLEKIQEHRLFLLLCDLQAFFVSGNPLNIRHGDTSLVRVAGYADSTLQWRRLAGHTVFTVFPSSESSTPSSGICLSGGLSAPGLQLCPLHSVREIRLMSMGFPDETITEGLDGIAPFRVTTENGTVPSGSPIP
jgi:hypothetical protein